MPHPLTAHLAACALLHLALLIPPRRIAHRHLAALFLPLICSCHVYSWTRGLGALAGVHMLSAAELLLWRPPREEFRLIVLRQAGAGRDKDDVTAAQKEPYPESLIARFWWVLKLIASPRFVGWDTGSAVGGVREFPPAPSIPPQPGKVRESSQSRSSWLLRKCLSIILCGLAIDATNSFRAFDPYFLGQTSNINSPLLHTDFHSLAAGPFGRAHALLSLLSPQLLRIVVLGVQQYATFSVIGSFGALVCVSLGGLGLVDDFWGGMQNWKPVMGSPLAICRRGLRGFWGGFWHQLFRYMFSDPGKKIAGIPAKSSFGYVIQVAVAFTLSGALHALSLPRNMPGVNLLRYAAFFWIQGACVVLEIIASHWVAKVKGVTGTGPPWLEKCLVVVRVGWTVFVLYNTVPLMEGELVKVALRMRGVPIVLFPSPRKIAAL